MKFIDWFAGIGGFRRGMELAGHECVGFCEFDKYAVMSYTAMHLCTQEQLDYLATLPMRERQEEILKEEYRNGEWYANDVRTVDARSIPDADCWCFGFPCQDISVAGKQLGFTGNRSSLFFRIMYMVGQLEEEKKPTYLFIENVKNLLSVNGGWDFAKLLSELDKNGYDAEWRIFDSQYYGVPQHRERLFIIGSLRGRSWRRILSAYCNNTAANQSERESLQKGIICGYGHKPMFTLTAQDRHGVAVRCLRTTRTDYGKAIRKEYENGDIQISRHAFLQSDIRPDDLTNTLSTVHKDNLIAESVNAGVHPCVWWDKYKSFVSIRRLTPKECFRLQGWTDDYFEKAEFVNSNSQLYKQAGNGVTVSVIEAIARNMT